MDYMNHLYGRNKKKIIENSRSRICECCDLENGKYVITEYEIFKGVKVFYNDIHTSKMTSSIPKDSLNERRYEINHCREGRFECVLRDGTVTYMEAGDFAINLISNSSKESFFPISHYHGVTFCITPSEFDEELHLLEKMFEIDYEVVLNELCYENKLFIQRATSEIEHIFFEMYKVPDDIVIGYLKVKFQELFLYLTAVKNNMSYSDRQYFAKNNIEIAKKINEYVLQNFTETITYEKLSETFHIKITTMKNCYKSIYGETINDTIIKKRLEEAALLLKNSALSITGIAIQVGYTDHSKFSNAFKKRYNLTPSEYKKISKTAHLV
ncbi:helix-turn-helix domain-containing protein [Mogibacterium sp. CM50]|jgi:AraC-type DNA-binding domain-containing proteins|uniref:helix-turn-helix domain-containing protein n=1 Tax=Mogibacterium sp. CM50 TaxID=936375 RepID=UPI00027C5DF9|nr:helix-turn-helix domain-containing protein [Mogibacterium sp. CM50]EJU19750.1 DNA-binding helix-turn-helix protein [Mogibacterium sp. CM50]